MNQFVTDQPIYDDGQRPPRPMLWIGLTVFFALCCCFFFAVSAGEAVMLFGGGATGGSGTPAAGKPAFAEVKFYLNAPSSTGKPSGSAVDNAPVNTKSVYGCFAYSGMPKTGATWGYEWQKDGSPIAGASKPDQRWAKEGSGTQCVQLSDDKGLKAGDFDLIITLNGKEAQFATLSVGQ